MKFVRWLIGRLVLAINFLTQPRPMERDPQDQQTLDAATAGMALYQFEACPFCVKVRRKLRKYALNIELRDAKNNAAFKAELTSQGGKHKVPCLRIDKANGETKWLYESDAIISFLETEFKLAEV